jgi:hypothetical protein
MMLRSRHTVRMRLTAVYCVLFILSAVVLLAITNGGGSSGSQEKSSSSGATTVVSVRSGPSHQYLVGSAIALGVMAVVSVATGWAVAGRALRPLRQMTATTRRISADSLHERLAIDGPADELIATRGGRPLDLSVKEFAVLEALLHASPTFLSAEDLLEKAWDEHADPFTTTVTVTISRLRRKLGDPPVITTTPGVGYRIASQIAEDQSSAI